MLKLKAAGLTDIGKRRANNEDAFLCNPEHGILAVADGMGGHAGGEIASQTVIDLLTGYYVSSSPPPEMQEVLQLANNSVFERSQHNPFLRGMGSTVVALHLAKDVVTIGHLGDSRCYRVRNDAIECLTVDHSLIAEAAAQTGRTIQELQARNFPANLITRACGLYPHSNPEISQHAAVQGDTYILCSDGVSGELSDEEILYGIRLAGQDEELAAKILIAVALEAGGKDNATIVVGRLV